MTTRYRHGDTSACTARIRPPWLTGDEVIESMNLDT